MLTLSDLYPAICAVLPADQVDHHYSDLYCKVTPATRDIIRRYEYRRHVTTFRDAITGALWYDIPFAYPGEWTK